MSIQQLLLGASGASGYNIDKSLRFRASASACLNRTLVASNRNKWTFNQIFKRGSLNSISTLFSSGSSNSNYTEIRFNADNTFTYISFDTATTYINLTTSQVFRDPASWYHICISYDDAQATASNRLKIYINGNQVTAFSTATYPPQSYQDFINGAFNHTIGRFGPSAGDYFDGYMAETYFIDGQALTPASFGETNALTGVWQPKAYTGTYGTNGFYLDFEDTSSVAALGTDSSGNGNTWTVNNVSLTAGVTYDSMTDVPTLTSATVANYPTLNPIYVSNIKAAPTLENANLTITPAYDSFMNATMSLPTTGKCYWEATVVAVTTGGNQTGLGVNTNQGDNREQHSFVSTLNDVWGVAVDMTGLTITWYKNNVSQSSRSITANVEYFPFFYTDTNISPTQKWAVNFGQRPFAYTPPTGFVALNTYNLPTATILKGSNEMNIALDTGANIKTSSEALFPSNYFEWIKDRANANNHQLIDIVRGSTAVTQSNTNTVETTYTAPSGNSVGWVWKANGTAVSNTAGTITSQVSANASAGFSVVTYTGNGTAGATVGHGLGVKPAFFVTFARSSAQSRLVYSSVITATNYLILNATDASFAASSTFNNTEPTSSVFSLGTSTTCNGSGITYVAYCWAEIDGFSKFGSYVGNGSADGPFVYLGFRPKFVISKRINTTGNWNVTDCARDPYNAVQNYLLADTSGADNSQGSGAQCDYLSNGFKWRNGAGHNNSGDTYIYMAFAENPFRNSLAR